MTSSPVPDALGAALTARERSAARAFVWRILHEVPAELVEAALFGSKARRTARPDSDVDILLVFARLPPDREPHAGIAERIAAEVAREAGVPVTVWSVSLDDTLRGNRTPMLVDALADAIPIWCWPEPLPPLSFTPDDALRCCAALLDRVAEGSLDFAAHLRERDLPGAALRARDDLVRLCTALHLLGGVTRPRRADAIRVLVDGGAIRPLPVYVKDALEWGAATFHPDRRDEAAVAPPPLPDLLALTPAIDFLRRAVEQRAAELAESLRRPIAPASG